MKRVLLTIGVILLLALCDSFADSGCEDRPVVGGRLMTWCVELDSITVVIGPSPRYMSYQELQEFKRHTNCRGCGQVREIIIDTSFDHAWFTGKLYVPRRAEWYKLPNLALVLQDSTLIYATDWYVTSGPVETRAWHVVDEGFHRAEAWDWGGDGATKFWISFPYGFWNEDDVIGIVFVETF